MTTGICKPAPHDLSRKRRLGGEPPRVSAGGGVLDPVLLDLVRLRVAKLHACALGEAIHRSHLKARGQSEERVNHVERWRQSAAFSEKERCALAMSEALSADSGSSESMCEELLKAAQSHFDRDQIVSLVLSIMAANDWMDADRLPLPAGNLA